MKSSHENDKDLVLHQTLARLLRQYKLSATQIPNEKTWQSLLSDVSTVFREDDSERKLLERASEVSSNEMRALNERLTEQASKDAMTGLLNRASLMTELEHQLDGNRTDESSMISVLFLDLDDFKLVNDRLGHAVGDELLCIVARRLQNCVGKGDLVARFGGDEFVILVQSHSETDQVISLANRIVSSVSRTICSPNFPPVGVGASVGVSTVPRGLNSHAERVLNEADLAMYSAKTKGRNCVVHFTPELELEDQAHAATEELRKAIVEGQLVLHFQPLVCLAHERIVAMESLVRWEHPERGMISPNEFIPLAESSGLIHDLTRNVLTQAINTLATWPEDLLVTVNLSSKDLAYHGTIDLLREQMSRTDVDMSRVIFEITENSLISWDKVVIEQLHAILDTGIRLAIDDFGSGYSSLSQLVDLPIQIVKLDRKFVETVSELETSQAIVRTVVELARTLGLMVVAKGIETADQADMLRKLGCDLAQGYHFGRPVLNPENNNVGCRECKLNRIKAVTKSIAVGF